LHAQRQLLSQSRQRPLCCTHHELPSEPRPPRQSCCRSHGSSRYTRHSSCCRSHGSGRCVHHGSCAVAVTAAAIARAAAAAATATAAAAAWAARATAAAVTVALAAVACAIAAAPLHAPRKLPSQPQQLPSERPLDPRHSSCCRSRGCSCCMRHGSSCGSRGRGHGSGRVAAAIACATAAAAAVAAAAAARATAGDVTAMAAVRPAAAVRASRRSHGSGRRTQPSFRASVAPWRVGNSAREDASPVCRRFAAWHAARLMPPALRRSTCAGLAAVGASTRRTWRTAQEGRARRAPAKGICVGHAAAGSEAQDEPEALRRRGPAAATQTACCTCNEL
jgi:hypothetical protein